MKQITIAILEKNQKLFTDILERFEGLWIISIAPNEDNHDKVLFNIEGSSSIIEELKILASDL